LGMRSYSPKCAQKVVDLADIVRDRDLRPSEKLWLSCWRSRIHRLYVNPFIATLGSKLQQIEAPEPSSFMGIHIKRSIALGSRNRNCRLRRREFYASRDEPSLLEREPRRSVTLGFDSAVAIASFGTSELLIKTRPKIPPDKASPNQTATTAPM